MSARLIIIGIFAIIDRFRKRKNFATPDYQPRVAVLIPAYNEEKVIVRTIRSVMMSNYKNIRIIVIDDGSKDKTYHVARDAYPADIASGRLTVLTKPNGGKAEALNFALERIDEEIYVGIDADGVIAHDAIANLVPALRQSRRSAPSPATPRSATASTCGRAGRRSSTSPARTSSAARSISSTSSWSFPERSARGAPAAVQAGGGYHSNTVAEDADLTMNLLEQGYSRHLRRPGARLHRGSGQRGWPDAAALPLVLRHPAGHLQAPRRHHASTAPWACSRCPIF